MKIKVFLIPRNHEYIKRLRSSLGKVGVQVKLLKPFHYSSLSNLARIIFYRGKGYRLIHVHWLYIFPFGLVMKFFYYFCRLLRIKIIWEMHNILPHDYKKSDRRNGKWFYEKVDAIIFHSENDVQESKRLLGVNHDKKKIIIPHGNFNESYENGVSKKDARKILNIPNDKKVILCFGFIRKNRGYEYLIEATKDMQDTIVIIAGKILEKDAYNKILDYERQVPNLRIFAKWIPNEEVQLYFNACDIVVLPYTSITTSGVVPLAYAFSRPVVTTSIGGIKDVVEDNFGILVPPNDSESLRNGINKLLSMDFETMGKYAYEYSNNRFNWGFIAREIKKLYETV